MNPQATEIHRGLDAFGCRKQETLEDIGEISKIEVVMKPDCRWQEHLCNSLMERQCCVDHIGGQFLNRRLEAEHLQMLTENAVVDCDDSFIVGEADSEHREVTLQSGVDSEASRSWVHA